MKQWPAKEAVLLSLAGIFYVFICSGCGKTPATSSSPDSATTSQTAVATERFVHTTERSRGKRQKTTLLPCEVSMWNTNALTTGLVVPTASFSGPVNLPQSPVGSTNLAHELVARLAHVDLSSGRLSLEQAKEMNELLRQLREL